MSWTSTQCAGDAGKDQLVASLVDPARWGGGSFEHKVVGNSLWLAKLPDEAQPGVIVLITLEKNEKTSQWRYRAADEWQWPFMCDCPPSLFELVPGGNKAWRERVLQHQATLRQRH